MAACQIPPAHELKQNLFRAPAAPAGRDQADLGLAALAKGDEAAAQVHILQALHEDPRDVYALLGSGLLYEATGDETKAAAAYQEIVALNPPSSVKVALWPGLAKRPVADVAAERLTRLTRGPLKRAGDADGTGKGQGGYENVLARFTTLDTLHRTGMMTGDEYAHRRAANRGALLPLTTARPAAGLDRPAPPTATFRDRLDAISAALRRGAISMDQHAAERVAILNGVMPASPSRLAPPADPPYDLEQAERAYDRLDAARRANLISNAEYRAERRAIGRSLAQAPAGSPAGPRPLSLVRR